MPFGVVFAEDVAASVDTRIGGSYRGHTFPGATCPFSLVQASPDTGLCDWDHCSGYVWEDPCIYGFSQTHLSGTGCPDLEDVRILPFSAGFDDGDPVNWRQPKDLGSEKGTPGFYTVALTNDGIVAEVTATPRVGVYRFAYAAGKPVKLLVDFQWVNAGGMRKAVVEFENALGGDCRSLSGGRRTHAWLRRSVYWKVVFDRPWTKATKLPQAQPAEKGERYVLEFAPGAPLVVKAAISTVDKDGAAKNLAAEAEGKSFDEIRAAARAKWNTLLSRLQVPGASAEQRTAFYTALYHLFIQPNDIADVDGRYRGGDAKVATAKDGAYYTGLSLWDTFRAAHPFYTLAVPERVDGFINSMLGHYRTLGFLPVIPYFGWESYCMIGNHSVPVIVDAYLKGFRGFDVDLAFEAVTNSLTVMHKGIDGKPKRKEDWEIYDRCGYYPYDKIRGESVSRTLECGFNDWCAAEFCAALGRGDETLFRRRSGYWKNVFDPETQLMRGRTESGSWRTPFDPFSTGHNHQKANDYTEGNAWQYTWHVLQDPQGLVAAMGGPKPFVQRLDSVFHQPEELHDQPPQDVTGLIGQYAHGNEPSHHIAYFYPFAGRPDRTAEVVREVCDRFYGVKPGDLCGNDDCGQMSAWYVFAAMGFYPFNPCGGDYVLGAPQFPQVSLALQGGKTFTMRAKNLSRENKYVKSVTLNGKPLCGFILKHTDIVRGGELVFEMSPRACAVSGDADFNVRTFGAKGDGTTKDTAAVQRALDACAKAGGGRVTVPPGIYLLGSVYLGDHTEFHLQEGATLLGSPDLADYNAPDAYPQNWGSKDEGWSAKHLILALEKQGVSITGRGAIDGNGRAFFADKPHRFGKIGWRDGAVNARDKANQGRPGQEIVFIECRDVAVRDITLRDMSCWSCFFHGCENVTVGGVTVRNNLTYLNSDGFDIDSCRNVTVGDCDIVTGDDAIAIRGSPARLKNPAKVCEDVRVSNIVCRVSADGVRVGVGSGTIRNVRVSDMKIEHAGRGLHLQCFYGKPRGKGVDISDISFERISTRDVCEAIHVGVGSDTGAATLSDIRFSHISAEGFAPAVVCGGRDTRVRGVTFTDCSFNRTRPVSKEPPYDVEGVFRVQSADDVSFANCKFNIEGVPVTDSNRIFSLAAAAPPNVIGTALHADHQGLLLER